MSIGLDGFGYYHVGGTGNAHHAYHQKKVMKVEYAVPIRLIGGVEKGILVCVGCANKANDGVGRSIHFSQCGYVIPRSQVQYINGFQSWASNDNGNRMLQDTPEQRTIDKVLSSFQTKDFGHYVLTLPNKIAIPWWWRSFLHSRIRMMLFRQEEW